MGLLNLGTLENFCKYSLQGKDDSKKVLKLEPDMESIANCRCKHSSSSKAPSCNLNPLFVSLLKHVGMRRLLEINDDRKQYHHFSPLVHISLSSSCALLDILKIFFCPWHFSSSKLLFTTRNGRAQFWQITLHKLDSQWTKVYPIGRKYHSPSNDDAVLIIIPKRTMDLPIFLEKMPNLDSYGTQKNEMCLESMKKTKGRNTSLYLF